jgi:DNA-binding transcriptional regulator GbsR (MarR family)
MAAQVLTRDKYVNELESLAPVLKNKIGSWSLKTIQNIILLIKSTNDSTNKQLLICTKHISTILSTLDSRIIPSHLQSNFTKIIELAYKIIEVSCRNNILIQNIDQKDVYHQLYSTLVIDDIYKKLNKFELEFKDLNSTLIADDSYHLFKTQLSKIYELCGYEL